MLNGSSAPFITKRSGQIELRPMTEPDLDAVLAIENTIYPFPWARGNFADSLRAGYACWVCCVDARLIAYFVLMMVVDEAHLLTIGVSKSEQRQGFGARLLSHALQTAQVLGAQSLLLEVRPSNTAALALYRQFGLQQIAVRRAYYPAQDGREDALIFCRRLGDVLA